MSELKRILSVWKYILFNPVETMKVLQFAFGFINRAQIESVQSGSKAIADFDQAIALPLDGAEFNNRGADYADLKKYDQAIADFDHAIALNPQLAIAFINRGATYEAMEKYDLAIADYESFIRLAGSEDQENVPGVELTIEELRLKQADP